MAVKVFDQIVAVWGGIRSQQLLRNYYCRIGIFKVIDPQSKNIFGYKMLFFAFKLS